MTVRKEIKNIDIEINNACFIIKGIIEDLEGVISRKLPENLLDRLNDSYKYLKSFESCAKENVYKTGITRAREKLLRKIDKASDVSDIINGWFNPWNEHANTRRAFGRERYALLELKLIKERKNYDAFRITKRGKRFLKERTI